jgi:hypothetical protein
MTDPSAKGLHPVAKDFLDFYKDIAGAVAVGVAAISFEHNPPFTLQGRFAWITAPWLFGGIAAAATAYMFFALWNIIVAAYSKASGDTWKLLGAIVAAISWLAGLLVLVAILTGIAKG